MTRNLTSQPITFLTESDEKIIVSRMLAGDQSARNQLILAHVPLADKMARRYARVARVEDARQDAFVALCEAVDKFDPTRGSRFATVALFYIRAALAAHTRKNLSIVARPHHLRDEFARSLRDGTVKFDAALDAPVGLSRETWAERLSDDNAVTEDVISERHEVQARSAVVTAALASLTPREREIVTTCHLAEPEDAASLADIGRRYGISRERARQIEAEAFAKLKASVRRSILARQYRQHEARAA